MMNAEEARARYIKVKVAKEASDTYNNALKAAEKAIDIATRCGYDETYVQVSHKWQGSITAVLLRRGYSVPGVTVFGLRVVWT